MSVKTRGDVSSHLSDYVGSGCSLLASELPTARDLLRLGIFLRGQTDRCKNRSVSKLAKEILSHLLGQWTKANAMFTFPVVKHKRTILRSLESLWKTASKIAWGRANDCETREFESKLDKLFDIVACRCPMQECRRCLCQGCQTGVHITCTCAKESKIPIMELAFIRDQREKRQQREAMHWSLGHQRAQKASQNRKAQAKGREK